MTDPTETERQSLDALANRFFAAIERADIDGVEQAYAPDVEYWINVTGEALAWTRSSRWCGSSARR